jgi:very-short-patch-repair endonuclease
MLLEGQLRILGVPPAQVELMFAKEALRRDWRFDFAWPDRMLAVEVEGGVWVSGRHTRGSGFVKDAEKYNAATVLGWRVLRYTDREVKNWVAAEQIAGQFGVEVPGRSRRAAERSRRG